MNRLGKKYHDPQFYDYLFSSVFKSNEEKFFIKNLEQQTQVYLFGGITRDRLISKIPNREFENTDDIDIVVKKLNKESIKKYIIKKTKFGGYKLKINYASYDIWQLGDTWNYNESNKNYNSDLEKLSELVFFSFNTSIYWINKRLWYISRRFNKSLRKGLAPVFLDNPYPELSILRAYKYFKKYNYTLSPKMKDYLKSKFDPIKLENYQKDRYGRIIYNIKDLYKYIMTNKIPQKNETNSDQLNLFDTL